MRRVMSTRNAPILTQGCLMRPMIRCYAKRVVAALVGGHLLLQAAPAQGFRTLEDSPDVPDDVRVRWDNSLFEYEVSQPPRGTVDLNALVSESRRAFGTWGTAQCTAFEAEYLGSTAAPAVSGDGVSTIEVVNEHWEQLGFSNDATGATDLLFEEDANGDWYIVEADILINAEHHQWSAEDIPPDGARSLYGVLLHEGGHALGLLHPCEAEEQDGARKCKETDSASQTIMYPFYSGSDIHLTGDDDAAMCFLYPSCETGGCPEGFECTERGCVGTEAESGEGTCGVPGAAGGTACGELLATGAACKESNQCSGGECLTGARDEPVCTRRCDALEDCPRGWVCSEILDRKVCEPLGAASGDACTLTQNSSGGQQVPLVWWFAGLLSGGAAWRRRRMEHRRSQIGEST